MHKELKKFYDVFGYEVHSYLQDYVIQCIKEYNTMSWAAQREFVTEFYNGEYVSLMQWMLKQPVATE